jgi:hypothetical protein
LQLLPLAEAREARNRTIVDGHGLDRIGKEAMPFGRSATASRIASIIATRYDPSRDRPVRQRLLESA